MWGKNGDGGEANKKGLPKQSPSCSGGETRIRTGGKGFAGPRLTTWPSRRNKKATLTSALAEVAGEISGAGYGIRTRGLPLGKVARYQLR